MKLNKHKIKYLNVLICVLLFSCSDNIKINPDRVMDFNDMESKFKNPSSEYRTVPLWVWNGDITKEDITKSS